MAEPTNAAPAKTLATSGTQPTSGATAPAADDPSKQTAPSGAKPNGDGGAAKPASDAKPAGDSTGKQADGDAKPPGEPAKPPAEPSKPTVPEKYEFKLPDGIKVDEAFVAKVTPVLKELGLTQEQAQKLVDIDVARYTAGQAKAADEKQANQTKWRSEAKADKDIGGEHHEQTTRFVQQSFGEFGSKALGELLDQTGLGDHPEFIRWARNTQREIARLRRENADLKGEDLSLPGGPDTAPLSRQETRANRMYHTTAKQ